MTNKLRPIVLRLTVFTMVCLLAIFALLVVFAQVRFDRQGVYSAIFSNVTGLGVGDFVRVAGVEVGKVSDLSLQPDSTVRVTFSAAEDLHLTTNTTAAIRYENLIGDRYLALASGESDSAPRLPRGGAIPLDRTSPALDLDALIGGFRPLFRALDPDQVNALSGQLIQAFQGQGEAIGSFFSQTAALTNTLADRDQLIGQVIGNLNTVLGSLSDHGTQFADAVQSLSDLMGTLVDRKDAIAAAVGSTDAASASIADLLTEAREPITKVVQESDRTAGIVVADHEYVENLVDTLPDAYRKLARQGMYGDFFSFYLCEAVLKMNGKGGQPVYVRLVHQKSGRCAPK